MKKVLMAISGGVDSALAALLLKKQGYEVHGIFMKNFSGIKDKITGECNWVQDLHAARQVAAFLEIPLIVVDFEKEYRTHVIQPLFEAYKKGITPNPDITCNTIVKFPLLWKEAQKRKYDYLATGHYARIKKTGGTYYLLRAKDESKDQSYFLYELSQADMKHTLFPIGSYTKKQVRALAHNHHFPNWDRPSTKGICFVGNVPVKKFLERKLKPKSGNVLNAEGTSIGTHRGAHYYTLGERVRPSIGIDIRKGHDSQARFFVAQKNMRTNTLVVVPTGHELLKTREFKIKELYRMSKEKLTGLKVRVRHLGTLMPATLTQKKGHWVCTLKKPITDIAPGQAAVFYKGTKILAGGEIVS